MSRTILQACVGLLVALGAAACEMTKSENPLGPSVAGPIPGVNITSPTPLEPAQGFRIAVEAQPITLTLSNAATTGVRPLNYLFEVATDAGFSNKVFSREGITPGESGRTTLRLPNALAPERSYYWRARAQDGANTGPYSAGAFFNVFTPVVLGKPILQEPVNNITATSPQPTLKFGNAPRSGPAGPITYEIQLSENEVFSPAFGIWAVDERPGQTTLAVPVLLTANKQYFWRVRGFESTTTGPWSDTQAFKVPIPSAGGGGGGGGGGASCGANPSKHIGGAALDTTRAERIVYATGEEFPCLLAVFPTEDEAIINAEQLLRRMIWHLRAAGFQANRQRNPSGLISNDKLTINIGGWHVYDVMTLGYAGVAGRVTFNEVPLPDPVPDTGIPD
jgi:hypothetical protein